MVAKKKGKAQVKVGKLNLKRETVKDLSGKEKKKVKGGVAEIVVKQPRLTNTAGCTAPSACFCQ